MIVCSTRVGLVGSGSVTIARDVADLLLALGDHDHVAVVIDAAFSTIELAFFARLARDFPPVTAILVQGEPAHDRRVFHEHGVYRAQFDRSDEGALPNREGLVDCAELVSRVIAMIEREPLSLMSLRRP